MEIQPDVLDLLAGMDGMVELGKILGDRGEGVISVFDPLITQNSGDPSALSIMRPISACSLRVSFFRARTARS